jgi:hypothetical protein
MMAGSLSGESGRSKLRGAAGLFSQETVETALPSQDWGRHLPGRNMMQRMLGSLFVVCLAGTALAESVPEFSLEYARNESTDIVVVDAKGKVLETWRESSRRGSYPTRPTRSPGP